MYGAIGVSTGALAAGSAIGEPGVLIPHGGSDRLGDRANAHQGGQLLDKLPIRLRYREAHR
jgi:hypothetical protein